MKKMKILVPANSMWPAQLQGQVVEVEINTIKFPDGICWGLESSMMDDYRIIEMQDAGKSFLGKPAEVEKIASDSVVSINERPKSVHIEF